MHQPFSKMMHVAFLDGACQPDHTGTFSDVSSHSKGFFFVAQQQQFFASVISSLVWGGDFFFLSNYLLCHKCVVLKAEKK